MARRRRVGAFGVLWASLLMTTAGWAQTTPRRPTPTEAMTQSLAPVEAALTALAVTDDERGGVADLVARAETAAAERVEAEHRRDLLAMTARTERIARIVEVLRARVGAMRAEARALDAERTVVAAETRRTQSRGALERISEAHILATRDDPPTHRRLPEGTPPQPQGASR